jgi:hypothetical protein
MHSSDQFGDLGFRLVMLDWDAASVPQVGDATGLRFAVAEPHPFREEARFRIDLPVSGRVQIEFFDLSGRRLRGGIEDALSAGPNEVEWKSHGLPSGVYLARLSALGRSEELRFVRVR